MPTTSSLVHKKFQPSSSSSQPLSPHKRQRQIPLKDKAEEEEGELHIPEFETLHGHDGSCQPQDLLIWRRPGVFDMDVSRPQRMHDLPIKDAPLSILYEVFAKKVDEFEHNLVKTA